MSNKTILFIDDETWRTDAYADELRFDGHAVVCLMGVDAAWEFFEAHLNDIQAAVIDVMLPSGHRYAFRNDLDGGFKTGLVLFKDMRSLRPNLPVIFLTNMRYESLEEDVEGITLLRVVRKRDFLPDALPGVLDELLEESKALAHSDEISGDR